LGFIGALPIVQCLKNAFHSSDMLLFCLRSWTGLLPVTSHGQTWKLPLSLGHITAGNF
jgi:hypothetical protein